MADLVGKTVAHYRIIEQVGQGGMGVVYKAEDTKLQRTVALKFLPLDVASDDELRKRFINEARTASALNHPNICTIYSVEDGEQPFIAMEFVAGQELRELIIPNSKFSIDNCLTYATQIAEGLQAAHKKGIVHRDIKPANIMVTDDSLVKVMDFGLAKMQGQPALTKTGSTLGTIAYMSPEQARNEEVDHRSDIFSFGAVLYELCSGRQPFAGDYEAATLYSVVHEEPESLPDSVPAELQRIVFKCLEKEVNKRYQSAEELLGELRQFQRKQVSHEFTDDKSHRPRAAKKKMLLPATFIGVVILAVTGYFLFVSNQKEAAPERKMLVVLPFENLGPPDQVYFAAGMTEEITSRLAAVRGLGVISRSSAARYNRTGKTMKEIADDFGVDYVLEGTVRWNRSADGDNKVRITPQLIAVSDDTQLWSERYVRVIDDIFAVQSEIAVQVVQKLGVTLLADDQQIIEAKPTENLEAYDYYLRGKAYWARADVKKDTEIAVQMYEKAVELDPNFAVAYAELSRARVWLWRLSKQRDLAVKAKQAADRARQLAPDLAETHFALGYYYYYGTREFDKALEQLRIVARRQPNNAQAIETTGYILRRQGKWEEGVAQLEKAVELDPVGYDRLKGLGSIHLYMRDYTQAERYLDRAISVAPDIPTAYIHKVQLYLSWLGSTERAEQVLEEAAGRIDRRTLDAELWALGRVLVRSDTLGYHLDKAETLYFMKQKELAAPYADSARTILQAKIKEQPESEVWHQWLGWAYAYLGRRENAIREARKAVELVPVSKDAYTGCRMVESLALLYTVVGEHDAAIDQLEYLLSIPSIISVPRLRFQPVWEPLRQHPRFKRLLEKYGGESR